MQNTTISIICYFHSLEKYVEEWKMKESPRLSLRTNRFSISYNIFFLLILLLFCMGTKDPETHNIILKQKTFIPVPLDTNPFTAVNLSNYFNSCTLTVHHVPKWVVYQRHNKSNTVLVQCHCVLAQGHLHIKQ